MKELSIEEKAKAYDRAIEELRGLLEGIHEDKCDIMEEDIIKIFPTLKESEDEKIRKRIISALVEWNEKCSFPGDSDDMIVWLEKQSESDETKAKNFLINKGYPIDANGTFPTYEEMYDIIKEGLEKQGEQKYADKVKPKFEVGDTMRTLQEAADGFIDGMPVVVSIDEEYYHCNNELIAIKDQDSYEYPPMNRIQKPAWSEEDEKMLRTIISDGIRGAEFDKAQIDWLKFLKDRYAWKPSDEQVKAVKEAACYSSVFSEKTIDNLISLSKQLKTLREE